MSKPVAQVSKMNRFMPNKDRHFPQIFALRSSHRSVDEKGNITKIEMCYLCCSTRQMPSIRLAVKWSSRLRMVIRYAHFRSPFSPPPFNQTPTSEIPSICLASDPFLNWAHAITDAAFYFCREHLRR